MQSNAKAKRFLWPDCAGYLLIFNLETNPTAPNFLWSLTFRESVENQLTTRESVR